MHFANKLLSNLARDYLLSAACALPPDNNLDFVRASAEGKERFGEDGKGG